MTGPLRVAIFGASSGIGIELVRRLAQSGAAPVAVTRGSASPALVAAASGTAASLQRADVLDPGQVERLLAGRPAPDAVVSLVGGRPLRREAPPDWDGNRHLIDAARASGIRRFVLVTSIGSGSSRSAAPWIARLILGRFMDLKSRAEEYLRHSGLDWTIIRPGHLTDRPATGRGRLLEDDTVSGSIARADVAALVQTVLADAATIGRTYSAVGVADAR